MWHVRTPPRGATSLQNGTNLNYTPKTMLSPSFAQIRTTAIGWNATNCGCLAIDWSLSRSPVQKEQLMSLSENEELSDDRS
jgi:hypothetical protein